MWNIIIILIINIRDNMNKLICFLYLISSLYTLYCIFCDFCIFSFLLAGIKSTCDKPVWFVENDNKKQRKIPVNRERCCTIIMAN